MSEIELMKTPGYTNPELSEILKQGGPVSSLDATTDIPALRATLLERKRALTAAAGPSKSLISETDHRIKTRDGQEIVVRVYRGPQSDNGPVMVMLHGGGFILGGLDNEQLLCQKWCEEANGISVNVEYRLAPEFKFPVPVFDCCDAVKWTGENPQIHGGDLSKGFIVAGVSAGANIACTVSHLARDEGWAPKLTGVYLSIPSILSPQAVPEQWKADYTSREENKDAPVLNQGAITLFRSLYEDDPLSPLMSPVIFPTGHKDLPPTYFQICGMDPLRDEGLIYEKLLKESGVPTKSDYYPGLPHGFWSWWPKAEFSQKQRRDSMAGLLWLLKRH